MTLIYGQRGQPAATIDEDGLFYADGTQMGFLDEGYIFSIVDGSWVGSFVNGIVIAADGDVHGFTRNCRAPALPYVKPTLSMVPPRLTSVGEDVRGKPHALVPNFLAAKMANAKSEWFK